MRSLVLALLVVLVVAAPASATYPGRDGRIAFFARTGCDRYTEPGDLCGELAFSAVLTVAPYGGAATTVVRCPGQTCPGTQAAVPHYSPDGRLIAMVGSTTAPAQVTVLRADGSLAQRLDVPAAALAGVDWLLDGRLVAHTYDGRRSFLIGADGVAHEVTLRPKGLRVWSARADVAIGHTRGIYVWKR